VHACHSFARIFRIKSIISPSLALKMASFRKISGFSPENNGLESSFQSAISSNSLNLTFRPKVNYDLSSFSPREGSAFLGHTTTPRDVSHILDSSHKLELNHALQEANQKVKFQLQHWQQKLREAEERATSAECELRALQSSMSPGDIDLSIEATQISKRLPSPLTDNPLKGMVSRRPASRNGGDESDLRCENLLLVIDDLRARLASTTQNLVQKSQSVTGDDSDLWRFAAMREQLRWADNVALQQSKKKEAALTSLRDVAATCKRSIRMTPQHLLPESFNFENSHEDPSDDAHQWTQRLIHAHTSMISRVRALEQRNQTLQLQCEAASKDLVSLQAIKKSEAAPDKFEAKIFEMLSSQLDEADLPGRPATFVGDCSDREAVRNLNREFLHSSPHLPLDKKEKSFHMLKRLFDKNAFMQDILEKLARNMNDQVALVDSILAEFKKLAKCHNSDSQLYSIQRSFQFIHQELVRLDECFHLITKRPPKESISENLWQI
jgi:hypothetical protein